MVNYIKTPKISIVTPSYNQSAFIEETIKSVLDQHYPNLEYIIIDGGSDDGSVDIIRKNKDNLAYWISEPDNGQYDAINKGFSHSTGEIMAWINSDDKYAPGCFSVVAEIFSTFPEIEWITSSYPIGWNSAGQAFMVGRMSGFNRESFYRGANLPMNENYIHHFIQQESTFWRRCLWQRAGGRVNPEFKYAADFDLWARFFEHEHLYGVNALLGGFRIQENQKTTNHLADYIQEAQLVLNRYHGKPYSKFDKLLRRNLNLITHGSSFRSIPAWGKQFLTGSGLFHKTKKCRWNGFTWEIIDSITV